MARSMPVLLRSMQGAPLHQAIVVAAGGVVRKSA